MADFRAGIHGLVVVFHVVLELSTEIEHVPTPPLRTVDKSVVEVPRRNRRVTLVPAQVVSRIVM